MESTPDGQCSGKIKLRFRFPRLSDCRLAAMIIKYMVRVTVQPPKSMICNVPSWKIEAGVQLTTDLWGTLDRDLIATGGIPTPALALAGAAPRAPDHATFVA